MRGLSICGDYRRASSREVNISLIDLRRRAAYLAPPSDRVTRDGGPRSTEKHDAARIAAIEAGVPRVIPTSHRQSLIAWVMRSAATGRHCVERARRTPIRGVSSANVEIRLVRFFRIALQQAR
jgi:hypothetical protein